MAKPTIFGTVPDYDLTDPPLSKGAKVIMRHFRDRNFPQMSYELPGNLLALFGEAKAEECERAEMELYERGLVELGREPPSHIPMANRVRAAAITLDGERYIQKHDLDA